MVLILLNIALTLGLISLASGIGLIVYGRYHPHGQGFNFARIFGVFIMILALISIFVTAYVTVNFWNASYAIRVRGMGQGQNPGSGPGYGPGYSPGYGHGQSPGMAPGTNGVGTQNTPSQRPPRKGNPNYPRSSIPANEQDMRSQNRPGPPEKINSSQNQTLFQEQNHLQQEVNQALQEVTHDQQGMNKTHQE